MWVHYLFVELCWRDRQPATVWRSGSLDAAASHSSFQEEARLSSKDTGPHARRRHGDHDLAEPGSASESLTLSLSIGFQFIFRFFNDFCEQMIKDRFKWIRQGWRMVGE